jgi:hypothetical protein
MLARPGYLIGFWSVTIDGIASFVSRSLNIGDAVVAFGAAIWIADSMTDHDAAWDRVCKDPGGLASGFDVMFEGTVASLAEEWELGAPGPLLGSGQVGTVLTNQVPFTITVGNHLGYLLVRSGGRALESGPTDLVMVSDQPCAC